jgi:hypothetical protein
MPESEVVSPSPTPSYPWPKCDDMNLLSLCPSSHRPWSVRHAGTEHVFGYMHLKVPKREIFLTELIILSYPIWTGDLGTKAKNRFV